MEENKQLRSEVNSFAWGVVRQARLQIRWLRVALAVSMAANVLLIVSLIVSW